MIIKMYDNNTMKENLILLDIQNKSIKIYSKHINIKIYKNSI